MKVAAEVELAASPQEVWRHLVAWAEQPRWMGDAASVRVVGSRREGSGVRLAVRTKVLGLFALLTDILEVTQWEPPRRLVVVRRGFVRGSGEWRLYPAATGTRFVWREVLTMPVPVLGELVLLAYRPVMGWLMRRSLSRLRALVASQPRSAR